ncbi:MAG: glutathione transferase GstA [Citromicrobium sp.]|nr:glutathione transferase GstA [Citromicrobium sp.]MAO96665.1 glutathione transferase GstA [Citromicrobium sp.]MAS86251.1 glutathione transferase GstA [Erythrobacteraceae bacterium]MBT45840.1 glutathione transferase GstA [Citromicrobium sp.]|tara:strand:- start:1247 stop:1828 length:582 start_codon:yes stop_codon:yes gene_type:complete
MKLYYSPGACSLASHIALIESGLDHELVKVDLGQHKTENGEDFYQISPRGYVPAIETDEFGLVTENAAVLPFLAQKMGALPDGEAHWRLHEWIGFIGTEIHKAYGPLFGGAEGDAKEKAKNTVAKKYQLAETLMDGREWLVGSGPSVADNYLFVTLLWADKFGVDLPQSLVAYRERHLQRDAVQKAMADEGLA